MKKDILVLLFVMVAGLLSAFSPLPKVDGVPPRLAALTADETNALRFMIEEEKMARDLYTAFFELYGSQSFQMIAASEQVHMDELKVLLDTYNISDPTIGKAVGVFTDSGLQALYDQLLAQGSVSLTEALKVGAAVEEIDILDLQSRIAQTTHADIQGIFAELKKGSENHLRAFARQINNQIGETYIPGYLTVEEYQRMIMDMNGGGAQGLQNGRGMQAKGRGMQGGQGVPGTQPMYQGFGMNQLQNNMTGDCSGSETCLNN